jgi:CRP-like cAMP-binding protein
VVQKVAVAQKKLEIVNEIVDVQLPMELMSHPALHGVGQTALTTLANRFDIVRVPRGASIYNVESTLTHVFFVSSGAVRMQHKNEHGETLESAYFQGFSLLGAAELLAGSDVMAETAVAAEAIVAFAVPVAVAKELCKRDISFLMTLAKALAARHEQAIKNERAALEPAFVRVASYLMTLSNREGKLVAPDLYLVKTTQDDIAAATGLNPRTVSRAMKVLQQKGRLYIRRGEYLLRQPLTLSAAFANEDIAE